MPINAIMLVRVKNIINAALLEKVRSEFQKKFEMDDSDFYPEGCFVQLSKDDTLIPVKDDTSTWINVNFVLRYFGEDYQKGNFELFDICAEWIENNISGCEIWYGSDENYVSITKLDPQRRKNLLDEYRKMNPQDLFTRRFR